MTLAHLVAAYDHYLSDRITTTEFVALLSAASADDVQALHDLTHLDGVECGHCGGDS